MEELVSLYPLDPEWATTALLQMDPTASRAMTIRTALPSNTPTIVISGPVVVVGTEQNSVRITRMISIVAAVIVVIGYHIYHLRENRSDQKFFDH